MKTATASRGYVPAGSPERDQAGFVAALLGAHPASEGPAEGSGAEHQTLYPTPGRFATPFTPELLDQALELDRQRREAGEYDGRGLILIPPGHPFLLLNRGATWDEVAAAFPAWDAERRQKLVLQTFANGR